MNAESKLGRVRMLLEPRVVDDGRPAGEFGQLPQILTAEHVRRRWIAFFEGRRDLSSKLLQLLLELAPGRHLCGIGVYRVGRSSARSYGLRHRGCDHRAVVDALRAFELL
jgi:hypothetical protein